MDDLEKNIDEIIDGIIEDVKDNRDALNGQLLAIRNTLAPMIGFMERTRDNHLLPSIISREAGIYYKQLNKVVEILDGEEKES